MPHHPYTHTILDTQPLEPPFIDALTPTTAWQSFVYKAT